MQTKFIISNESLKRIDNERCFIACPFTAFIYEEDKNKYKVKKAVFGDFLRKDRKTMDLAINFIQNKYEKYIPVLSKRLNSIHQTNYPDSFWKKCFSLGLLRHLTLFHDIFEKCETYFNPKTHTCEILHECSYIIPDNYQEHRQLFQASFFGQEQILSQYMQTFYYNNFKKFNLTYGYSKVGNNNLKKVNIIAQIRKAMLKKYKTIFKFGKKTVKKSMAVFFSKYSETANNENLIVGLCGAYFSRDNKNQLLKLSNGKIGQIGFPDKIHVDKKIDKQSRVIISKKESWFDSFDEFFFNSLYYALPKNFIEHFSNISSRSTKILENYPKLKYIVSEAWLSNNEIDIMLAVAKQKGIYHIYNEHNSIFYPFTGQMVNNIGNMVDKYVTFGWLNKGESDCNFVQGASLFPFLEKNTKSNKKKKYDILYISYMVMAKMPYYGGTNGFTDFGAIKHLEFVESFFSLLETETLKRIGYRGYPKDYFLTGLKYNKEKYLQKYLEYTTILSSSKNDGETAKQQMSKSKIVVIDRTSTAYLEALWMNIPTIVFFDPDVSYLEEEYSDFFKPLIDAKICHTNSKSAAQHLESIKNDPKSWWNTEYLQRKKDEWLSKNFKDPKIMIDYLLKLSCS